MSRNLDGIWMLEDDMLSAYHQQLHDRYANGEDDKAGVLFTIHDEVAEEMQWRGMVHSSPLRDGIKIANVYNLAYTEEDIPYSPDDEVWQYVVHRHFKGTSCHLDWRMQDYDSMYGWRVNDSESITSESVTTLSEAMKLHNESTWKIDWRSGSIRSYGTRKGSLPAKKLDISSLVWLSFSGVIDEEDEDCDKSILITADYGQIEWGAQKEDSCEVFLSGGKLSGRWLFKRIDKESGEWILMQPASSSPYVLSQRAIDKRYLPPRPLSALPNSIRSQVPNVYKYWLADSRIDALEMREKLSEMTDIYEGNRYKMTYSPIGRSGGVIIIGEDATSTI